MVGNNFKFIRDREMFFRIPVRGREIEISRLPVGLLSSEGTFGAEVFPKSVFHSRELC